MNANGNESRPPKFIRLRRLLSKGAGWLFPRGESHALSRTIALRGLGAVYLTAILSWWAQVDELVCRDGLVPMAPWLDQVGEVLREREIGRWAALPTLFWFADSDTAIHAMCAIGTVLAVAVVAGLAPGPCLAGLWLIYLSLAGTGDVFMHFQWDILLLEAGFLAIFLAPWKVRRLPWRGPQPMLGWGEKFALWLQWIVVAKLMFQSGWVKLAWATPRQPEWWPDFSAMTYHYLTQPIPSWTSWWMHRLPEWWHKAEIWPMYGVELVLPFFVFLGARLRLVAALGFAGLMLSILATGNFAYFNWLTIVLSIPLVADRYWSAPARLWRRIRKTRRIRPRPNRVESRT